MANLYKRLTEDGSLFTLKYILIFILLFSIFGAVFGIVKVSLFEQSPSGRYALHKECDEQDPRPDEPCDIFKTEVSTLGKRQMDQAKFFALIFGIGPGLVLGMTIGQERWKKRKK